MQVKADKDIGRCGCGRSPTGYCVGWHGLTQEAYEVALENWQDKSVQTRYTLDEVESEGGETD